MFHVHCRSYLFSEVLWGHHRNPCLHHLFALGVAASFMVDFELFHADQSNPWPYPSFLGQECYAEKRQIAIAACYGQFAPLSLFHVPFPFLYPSCSRTPRIRGYHLYPSYPSPLPSVQKDSIVRDAFSLPLAVLPGFNDFSEARAIFAITTQRLNYKQ